MGGLETTLGGSRENFPETVWSSVLAEPASSDPNSLAVRDRFFSLYWRPVYKFIRTAGRASIEDAKDLTQSFFASALEREVHRCTVRRSDPIIPGMHKKHWRCLLVNHQVGIQLIGHRNQDHRLLEGAQAVYRMFSKST
jgi:hypothetical protein